MSKISFYQVMNGEAIKYACQLLEKCYTGKMKTFVQVSDDTTLEILNKSLWTFAQKAFIPHGSKNDPLPEKQPIYLSTSPECPIEARVLMLLDVERTDLKEYERVIIIIDGLDKSKVDKNKLFAEHLSNLGHSISFYIQNNKGAWEKV